MRPAVRCDGRFFMNCVVSGNYFSETGSKKQENPVFMRIYIHNDYTTRDEVKL